MIHSWKAYYADGSVFDSTSSCWSEIPDDGLVILDVYLDEYAPGERHRRRLTADNYGFDGFEILAFDDGEWPLMPGYVWKRGVLISDAAMREIVLKAQRPGAEFNPGDALADAGGCGGC